MSEFLADDECSVVPRRTFIDRLAGGAAALSLALLGCAPDAGPIVSGDNRLGAPRLLRKSDSLSIGRPSVGFVPSAYDLSGLVEVPLHAFGVDVEQMSFVYLERGKPDNYSFPLMVHVAVGAHDTLAGIEEGRVGETIQVTRTNGRESVVATYHDGMWLQPLSTAGLPRDRPYWAKGTVHSLVFVAEGYSVGVRGVPGRGIDLATLGRVAGSVSVVSA